MGKVICDRVCTVCGKHFEGNGRSKYCSETCKKKSMQGVCVICGKPTPNKKVKTCSKECFKELCHRNSSNPEQIAKSNRKIKETKLKHYGDANYNNRDKAKKTSLERYGQTTFIHSELGKKEFSRIMLERYGVEHALQNTKFVEKMNETIQKTGISYRFHTPEWEENMIKKYGVTVPYKNKNIKNKGIQTLLERYGVTSPAKLDWVKEKSKNTCLRKYGVEYSFQSENNKIKSKNTLLSRYGVENAFFLHRRISKINKTIGEFLGVDSYEFPLKNKQYDLKLDNTLIEINPTISHNSDVDFCYSIRPVNYHYDKTKLARDNGFRCFNIWDWDDLDKVKGHFNRNKQKIYAKNCEVVFIDKTSSDWFLNQFHFQGSCRGDYFRVGLIYQNKIIGVMTFGSPRYSTKAEVELLRLCFDYNFYVVGGSEKMFSFFISQLKPSSIISYCDNSKFEGYIYSKLNFSMIDKGVPTAHWFRMKDKKHFTDALLRQYGADALIGTTLGKGSDNTQIMLDNGFVRVYDCGQSVYLWKSKGSN